MSLSQQQISQKIELPFSFLLEQHFALSFKKHSKTDLANYAFGTQVKLIKIH